MFVPAGDSHIGTAGGVYCWPSYLDQHVAQLDFDTSMVIGEDHDRVHHAEDVIASVMMNADPNMISTDSLDIETLRARCENNQPNDYKLTFEDSGQWTTSGIGGSFTTNNTSSPPVSQNRRNGKESGQPIALYTNNLENHNLALRLLEELNNLEKANGGPIDNCSQARNPWATEFLDEILNNNNNNNNCCTYSSQIKFNKNDGEATEFTTWGRIRDKSACNLEPFNSEKVISLPELNCKNVKHTQEVKEVNSFANGTISSPAMIQPPNLTPFPLPLPPQTLSLKTEPTNSSAENLTNQLQRSPNLPLDYVYSETYLGDGRYIDLNENEIGYIPPNTASIQRVGSEFPRRKLLEAESNVNVRPQIPSLPFSQSEKESKREMSAKKSRNFVLSQQKRTFADLSTSQTVPDLKFIELTHKVPSIYPSSNSFDNLLSRTKDICAVEELLTACCLDSERIISEADAASDVPDSGLGSSHSEGPSHIEDWSSLSLLLPRNVVEAFSFFKSNSFLLASSSNNIEGKRPPRSCTSIGGVWRLNDGLNNKRPICQACLLDRENGGIRECSKCVGQTQIGELLVTKSAVFPHRQIEQLTRADEGLSQKLRLHAKELAIIGLPIYDQKRNLIERVVEGVAEIVRGASSVVLLTALEKLLGDELLPGVHPWNVICEITGQGPVTRCVYQLIRELGASEKPEHSRLSHFFKGLLELNSLDGWISYIVLKENVLSQFYASSSFLRGSQSSYRSLYWRLMESVELLAVLNQTGGAGKRWERCRKMSSSKAKEVESNSAAKLPSDSRVPKSSSLPTKLSKNIENNAKIVENEIGGDRQTEGMYKVEHEKKDGGVVVNLATNVQKHECLPTLRASRIPIFSRTKNLSGSSTRSHSSSSRRTPTPFVICSINEEIEEQPSIAELGTILPLKKGEFVRVLSVRGAYSRCSRLQQNTKRNSALAISNGIVPTRALDFEHN